MIFLKANTAVIVKLLILVTHNNTPWFRKQHVNSSTIVGSFNQQHSSLMIDVYRQRGLHVRWALYHLPTPTS